MYSCFGLFFFFTLAGKCSLTIDKALPEDEGRYLCKAENAEGKAECSCMVHVDGQCLKNIPPLFVDFSSLLLIYF